MLVTNYYPDLSSFELQNGLLLALNQLKTMFVQIRLNGLRLRCSLRKAAISEIALVAFLGSVDTNSQFQPPKVIKLK